MKCAVDICNREAAWVGLCEAHYWRKWKSGDVQANIPLKEYPSVKERIERFTMPVTESGCLLWIGKINVHGYGSICITENKKKRTRMAHRLVWELEKGPIPKGLFVCHKCDTPSCVNINHLFLGDAKANVKDMISKGRKVSPYTNTPQPKLNEDKVREILLSPDSRGELAKRFGVARGTIQKIKERRRWKHVTI